PDRAIGSVPFKAESPARLLETPLRFLALNPRSLADIESDIRAAAGLVGRRSAASLVIRRMRHSFAKIRQKTRGKHALRVYSEAWPNPRIASPPWVAELVAIAGGEMVVPVGQPTSDEQMARANPDVIILAWAAAGDRAKPARAYAVE